MSTAAVRERIAQPVDVKKEEGFQYPGMPTTCDGAEAVVHVEINVAQAAGAYPITSSTTMGGGFNAAVMNGYKNLWGDTLLFFEPESEHSAATVCEGFAVAGGRVTNFTSGQGLVLMKEVLYTIAGKRLPVVMNIGARALTSQGLNVHAGHDDVMSVADCGWGMLFGRNAQEAGDLCLICRRAAEASFTPFFNVQDGFLTTHTVETVRLPELEFMKEYIGDPKQKLINLMDPANPVMSGVVQNQDSYMKGKIAQRWYYDRIEGILEECFQEFYRKTGRQYSFLEPYRCEDAEYIIIGMGCYMETAKVTVDYLRNKGVAAGCVSQFVFRPFPGRHVVEALKNCKAITVFERMDDPLSTTGNHLTREIKAAFCDAIQGQNGQEKISRIPRIYGCAAGLGSRDVRPGDIIAAFENMMHDGQDFFCVGIDHPLALKRGDDPDLRPSGGFSMRGHSVGGFGSVTTNKVIATIAGNVFGKDVQAYPKYGSEKKGLPTTYYLTIADSHINIHCELEHVDLLCINDPTAILNPLTLEGLQAGTGAIFMQSPYNDPKEVWAHIPDTVRKILKEKKYRVFFCDMVKIAREVASEADLQMRMQGIVLLGAFLKLTPYAKQSNMSDAEVYAGVEKALRKYFGKRGDRVVQDNLNCVKQGYNDMKEIPQELMAS